MATFPATRAVVVRLAHSAQVPVSEGSSSPGCRGRISCPRRRRTRWPCRGRPGGNVAIASGDPACRHVPGAVLAASSTTHLDGLRLEAVIKTADALLARDGDCGVPGRLPCTRTVLPLDLQISAARQPSPVCAALPSCPPQLAATRGRRSAASARLDAPPNQVERVHDERGKEAGRGAERECYGGRGLRALVPVTMQVPITEALVHGIVEGNRGPGRRHRGR